MYRLRVSEQKYRNDPQWETPLGLLGVDAGLKDKYINMEGSREGVRQMAEAHLFDMDGPTPKYRGKLQDDSSRPG